jgi:branched-chain amino acid transport system permease protein
LSQRPGALEQEFTPGVDDAEHVGPPIRRRQLTTFGRSRGVWLGVGIVFVAWCVWAFLDNPTLFVALTGAGLAEGAIVALAAIGFLMIQKATGIANFAQGDLITLGAFLGIWATDKSGVAMDGLGLSLGLGYLVTLAVMFMVGVAIERVAYAPLRGRSVHVVVIATLGVALVIRTILGLWQGTSPRYLQSWFSSGNSLQNFLFFDNGVLRINVAFLGVHDAVISAQRVVVMVVTAVTVLAMMLLFSRTSFGRQVRAIAADREMARLCGVKANRLSMLAFGISAALAGLAGLLIGPLGSFDLTLGFAYMLLGFAAAVLGGFGSLGGVAVGAVLIGLTEQLLGGQLLPMLVEKLGGDAADALKYRSTLPYVLMLVVIALKPQGLFGGTERRL